MEKLPLAVGDRVEFEPLLVADGESVTVGHPTVEGAKVVGEVTAQTKDKKVVVFKYKPKTRYRRKNGHRQPITEVAIRQILTE